MLCSSLRTRIRSCFRDYDQLQFFAVILIYVQIGCALIGSLGALYNGVLLINLVIALFALVAIESSSQSLGRTYAVLLCCGTLLDIFWFILFSHQIWNISSEDYGPLVIFSLRLTLSMQIIGFSVRVVSSVIWIQIYRLGVSCVDGTASREDNFDLRNSFLNPSTPAIPRQNSHSDDILGGSIYDPAYYSSLFEDIQDNGPTYGAYKLGSDGGSGSSLLSESSQLKSCISRSFQVIIE
ncbi:transmembrane protein [Thalictrum thalictroides]|uniref:Transmembrane protein n=1 Tax=Thalictrum thalictroides TaxID=46969 RepID=A0A7J6XG95_THATH|nr:transmembrane protein [Thalictrum thalictroides]